MNEVYEVEAETVPAGPDNPWGNAFRRRSTRARDASRRRSATTNAATSRARGGSSTRTSRNGLGQPGGYKLVPTMCTPTLLAHPDSSVGRRAGFAQHNLWVTPYAARRAARRGRTTRTSTRAATACPAWTAADRSLVDTDVVLWYTFGVTHFVRPEDWPVMPVEYTGFLLSPVRLLRPQPRPRRPAHHPRATATPN